jgi:hypothetical protein
MIDITRNNRVFSSQNVGREIGDFVVAARKRYE